VREVQLLAGADFQVQESDQLVITPSTLAYAMKRAARSGVALILTHSHPFATTTVGFSVVDDAGERRIFASARQRVPGPVHASMVFGQQAVAARAWASNGPVQAERVVVVGPHLHVFAPDEPNQPDERYDRQVRAFGRDGQCMLAHLRVGVVGCGGTGSAVAEQLSRLGVGHVVAVDPEEL
jgi:hypothetical protein